MGAPVLLLPGERISKFDRVTALLTRRVTAGLHEHRRMLPETSEFQGNYGERLQRSALGRYQRVDTTGQTKPTPIWLGGHPCFLESTAPARPLAYIGRAKVYTRN
ncbi:hypothetical protein J6590_048331 [Homalodisca vitripennis]|nr:hypothetical protein J6590_048331 [Homalodisca vitripennis]